MQSSRKKSKKIIRKKNNKKNNKKKEKKNNYRKKKELMIGGQAVIEGVMMRTKNHYAVAVRKSDNRISVKKERFDSLTQKNRFLGLPIVRGIIILIETIILGFKALNYSASQSLEQEYAEQGARNSGEAGEKLNGFVMGLTIAFSVILALALFKFLPLLAATLFKNNLGGSNFLFNLIDGATKLLVLIGYIWLISRFKDVKRVFEYHGAEHKTVHCYESGKKLTPKNAMNMPKAHHRCGTTFLLVVVVLSIIFYLLIPFNMNFWLKLVIRILFLPLIAGLSYEWIKLTGRIRNRFFTRILAGPGLLVQRLTTREPDEEQLSVAIKALRAVTE